MIDIVKFDENNKRSFKKKILWFGLCLQYLFCQFKFKNSVIMEVERVFTVKIRNFTIIDSETAGCSCLITDLIF